MSLQLITTSNADRNLAAGVTVLSATPDASNPRLCYALILLGDGTKNLAGVAGDFSVTITIAGNTYGGGAETYTVGAAARVAIQTTAFFVPANAAVTIAITSPNAGDTDVDCTAYLVSEDSASQTSVDTIDDFIDTEIAAIKAKTDLIGTGSATVSAPVSDDGTIDEIIIGDDYLAANDRAFEWTVEAPAGFTIADCTCHFGGSAGSKGSWSVTGTITDAGAGNWLLSFDLAKSDTASCSKGAYEWSVAVHDNTGVEITKVRVGDAKVALVEKFT